MQANTGAQKGQDRRRIERMKSRKTGEERKKRKRERRGAREDDELYL